MYSYPFALLRASTENTELLISFEQPGVRFKKQGIRQSQESSMVIVGDHKLASSCDQVAISKEPTEETIFFLGTVSENAT